MDATLSRVTALGGSVLAPKMALPGLGFWAVFADPDGIPVGIMQMQ
jgi:predicted enzyme related to lactoylglutathione lyase